MVWLQTVVREGSCGGETCSASGACIVPVRNTERSNCNIPEQNKHALICSHDVRWGRIKESEEDMSILGCLRQRIRNDCHVGLVSKTKREQLNVRGRMVTGLTSNQANSCLIGRSYRWHFWPHKKWSKFLYILGVNTPILYCTPNQLLWNVLALR
jgi:hypothetical protein